MISVVLWLSLWRWRWQCSYKMVCLPTKTKWCASLQKQKGITSQKTNLNTDLHGSSNLIYIYIYFNILCVCIFFLTFVKLHIVFADWLCIPETSFKHHSRNTLPLSNSDFLHGVHSLPFVPVLIHINPLHAVLLPFFPVSILILSSHLCLLFQASFIHISLTNNLWMHFSSFSCMLCAKTIVPSMFSLS